MNAYRMLYFLWFLRLFKPEWILTYYVPGLGFIRSIATVSLYGLFIYLIAQGKKLTFDKPVVIYFLAVLVSAIFAYNTGRARNGVWYMFDTLLFFAMNVAIVKDDRYIDKILNLYLAAFVFYGISGVIYKGRVPFHVFLSDEDAFGPFMVLGVPLAFFLAMKDKKLNYWYVLVGLVSVLGLIASFARGAFLALCGVAFFIWLKSPRKFVTAVAGILMALFFAVAASILFEGSQYWEEMASINESVTDDSKDGRHWLIEKAIMMYTTFPLIGVGPFNYGPALIKLVPAGDSETRTGWDLQQLYGRVPHNIYLQVLAELGTVGMIAFLGMIYVFWKRNSKVQKRCRRLLVENRNQESSAHLRRYYYYSLALSGAMVAYLFNGPFYDLLYYHWFFDLQILNFLVYRHFEAIAAPKKCEAVGELVHV